VVCHLADAVAGAVLWLFLLQCCEFVIPFDCMQCKGLDAEDSSSRAQQRVMC
jgi:hypothetical protein